MADIAFNCPQCGRAFRFAPHLAGKRGRCASCQAVFRIPEATPAPPPPDDGKVAFNCPTCGRGYRLDTKLAGKQGRCTSCRGVFTIPGPPGTAAASPPPIAAAGAGPARPQTRPDPARSSPPASRSASGRPPATATVAAAGDSGWWELDSSESIPAATARGTPERKRTAPAVASTAVDPSDWSDGEADAPVVVARPAPSGTPRWVVPVSIGAAVVAGSIAFAITWTIVSGRSGSPPPPAAEQTKEQPAETEVAKAEKPEPNPAPKPEPTAVADQHREAVDALIRAYNQIADGYARIRDVGSVSAGQSTVDRGIADLRSAARRGQALPALPASQRLALVRETGRSLLQAVDRVLGELRRLRATPGLRSDFDSLIDAYTQARQEIQGEVDRT